MWISILITIVTLVLTIVPLTGQISPTKEKRDEYRRWQLIKISATLLMILSWIQTITENSKQDSRDEKLSMTTDNTTTILNRMDSSTRKIEKTLIRSERLNAKLDSLDAKTEASIEERDEMLTKFNQLNKRLEKLYFQQADKLKENPPNVIIAKYVEWKTVFDRLYIEVYFQNIGSRITKDFDFGIMFFEIDKESKVLLYKNLSELYEEGNNEFSPTEYKGIALPVDTKTKKFVSSYLYVFYTYTDELTGSTYKRIHRYSWDEKENGNDKRWISFSAEVKNFMDEQIHKNKVELRTVKQKIFKF